MDDKLTVRTLMASGVHFGHRSSRWNPKMKPFIFMKRNLVHIIDLRQTVRNLHIASRYLTRIASKGGQILFVGTKRQARSVTLAQARKTGMHYVTERWLGGTLTNFSVIRKRLKRLEELENLEATGRIKMYSKKMQASILRIKAKMLRNLEGIRKMTRLPDALVVVDPGREHNAIHEARRLGISVIAVLDTDGDPESVDIPIPANDDAMRSISILFETLGDAVLEGVEKYKAYVGPIPERSPAVQDARGPRRRPPGREGRSGPRGQRPAAPAAPPVEPSAAPPAETPAAPPAEPAAPAADAATEAPAGDAAEGGEAKPE